MAEDGGDDGIAHEADIAKHQGKADGTLVVFLLRQITRQQKSDAGKHSICNHADKQQWQNVLTVR